MPRVAGLSLAGSERLAVSKYRKVRVCSIWEMSHFVCAVEFEDSQARSKSRRFAFYGRDRAVRHLSGLCVRHHALNHSSSSHPKVSGVWGADPHISCEGEGRGHPSSQGWMRSPQVLAVLLDPSAFWGQP